MKKLELVKTKNYEGIFFVKVYKYNNFDITVKIQPDGFYIINGGNKKENIEISASKNKEALLTVSHATLTQDKIKEFISDICDAEKLMEIIDNNREELIKQK